MSVAHGSLEWLVVGLAVVFGLFVGSFLNVVVYRTPLGLSVSTPRSFCPTCDRQLAWWENVPVVSWLALRGRCHTCHQPISVRYPLVESTTAVVFGLVAWAWHGNSLTAGYCVLAAAVIAGGLIEYGGSAPRCRSGPWAPAPAPSSWWPPRCGSTTGQWRCGRWLASWPAVVAFAVLRTIDPDCHDPLWHGRALLPAAGCWLGGIGGASGVAVLAGTASWILAEAACLVALWAHLRRVPVARHDGAGLQVTTALDSRGLGTARDRHGGGPRSVPHRRHLTTYHGWMDRSAPSDPRAIGGALRTVIVDDHELLRSGTRGILDDADGFVVVGEAADADAGVPRGRRHRSRTSSSPTSGSPRPTASTWPGDWSTTTPASWW